MGDAKAIDVLILGAGGGGYPAAFFLAKAGLDVVMVDRFGNLGGDCLTESCVPSKAPGSEIEVQSIDNRLFKTSFSLGAGN